MSCSAFLILSHHNTQAIAVDLDEHRDALENLKRQESQLMAESPSGHQFVVKKVHEECEESYHVLEQSVQERFETLQGVSQCLQDYGAEEDVIVNVFEETKGVISENNSYGVDIEKVKADFGRINVSKDKFDLHLI